MLKFFAEKMWVAFAATHIFSAKNIRILCIGSAKTVNEMTLNKLVKLTTLWTTGPRAQLFKTNNVIGDNLHEMSRLIFWDNNKNIFNLSSATCKLYPNLVGRLNDRLDMTLTVDHKTNLLLLLKQQPLEVFEKVLTLMINSSGPNQTDWVYSAPFGSC